ncbi:hypothetical protein H4R21_000572 [Coemansia helicoidea]|uniref:Uncharacterized protein n=1 Tax=Coemansia helicoidea TaxID=1286919 RepID=A0ACC1LFX9_9FUNG|nr:hypothetical protein H4R21_000572 [Coemansia helicoidea]
MAPRQDAGGTVAASSKGMLKVIYIILLVLWALIVAIVLFLAYRRYKLMRARRLHPDADEPGTVLARAAKRKLTEVEVAELTVATLTDDDIQRSQHLAASPRIAAPVSIHAQACGNPAAPPRTLQPIRRIGTTLALAAPAPAHAAQRRSNSPAMPQAWQPRRTRSLPRQLQVQPWEGVLSLPQKDGPAAPKRQTLSRLHEENCAVCLDDFAAGDTVRQLPCQHYFHTACIDPWLLSNSAVCPLCNFDVGATFDASKEGSAEQAR